MKNKLRNFIRPIFTLVLVFSMLASNIPFGFFEYLYESARDQNVVDIMWQARHSRGVVDSLKPKTALAVTAPVIEAGDITASGNNATSALWVLNTPAYDVGDLIIFNIASDANVTHNWPASGGPAGLMPSLATDSGCNSTCGTSWSVSRPAYSTGDLVVINVVSDGNVSHNWSATGPNGETVVDIVDSYGSAATAAQRVSAFYYIATDSRTADTFTVTSTGAEEWTATAFIVPAGDFNATTPIDSSGTGGGSLNSTAVPTPAWDATSGAENGLVVAWMGVDADPMTVVPTGWISVQTVDRGNVAGTLAVRATRASASESIASVNFTIGSDTSSTLGYVINTSGSESSSSATIVDLVDSHGAGTAQRVSAFYFVATESRQGGYVLVTPSAVEQWTGVVVRVPTGEFDPTTPIQATVGTGGSSASLTTVPSPTWTSSTADGCVVVWLGVDADPMTGTPAGWTNISSIDRGNVAGTLATRDTPNTEDEVIASANWTIAGDSSSTLGYVVNALPDPTFEQEAYRLFENVNSTDVGTALATQDTTATLSSAGDAFRLRMLIHIGVSQLGLSGESFKLQFAEKSDTCDTEFSGESYADVTDSTAIAYSTTNSPEDGDDLMPNANDPDAGHTVVDQDYEEANNFTNTVEVIPAGQDGKWDFSLIDNGAPAGTAYCFRVVESDGALLDTYTVIPEITIAASAPVYSVSITSSGVVEYGFVELSTASSTVGNGYTQTAQNDGNTTERLNVKSSDATGGTIWTLASTIGANQFTHEFSTTTGSTWTVMPDGDTYVLADPSVANSGTVDFDFRLTTPNDSADYEEKSITITVQAVAP